MMQETTSASLNSSFPSLNNLKKSNSREMLMGSRMLFKENKLKKKLDALIYKQRKQAEGEESEKEPDTSGLLKWREESEIHSVKFSPDGLYIAAALGNGNISVYSTITNTREFILNPKMDDPLPCTSIAFRPDHHSFRNKNIFAATCRLSDAHQ
ncbi:hypothetical protein HDU91_006923 [Kappamyces sp. JEL0680]|nr:hypothetical protein HDU91_006923 [Kappamyces sp. JEL0680]